MIAIIDYGVGNLRSILNMHIRLGIDAAITRDSKIIASASHIIIPGVGHFDSCMVNFNASDLRELVEAKAHQEKIPVLGICVGAQMMTRGSEEGKEPGLAWLAADTVFFKREKAEGLKIPHMGWSDVEFNAVSPLWKDMPEEPRFYFAHSYHFNFEAKDFVIASTEYGYHYPCAFQKENIFGVQFHPEKSHRFGMKVLSNFASVNT